MSEKDSTRDIVIEPYEGPAGGWGSLKSVANILHREHPPLVSTTHQLLRQNKPKGFACVSCAWAKPAHPHPFEFCENGAKATAWELTNGRATPEFFAAHTIAELQTWSDYQLEQAGRLTHPMRYDAASDTYVAVEWDDAFRDIGKQLQQFDPDSVVFYSSGRASLETSYMYALFARMFGTNNLPDSSNMCHETTGAALRKSIGSPVGTVVLDDFEKTDAMFFFGHNTGSNSPRMLHELQRASKRGVPIVTFNPLRERGLERFTNPQNPIEMLTGSETRISCQYHQVKTGGDIAAIMGMCKEVIEMDDAAIHNGASRVLDHEFIAQHTSGFEEFAKQARATEWSDIEHASGLDQSAIRDAARIYANAKAVIGVYGMGLTQHHLGEHNLHMLANLLFLRGNIGKPGAGLCPVRGHSNVQGQRTVGIADDPKLVPLDKLKELYGFEPPRKPGLKTIDACEKILKGEINAFVGLGGNFVRAIPDTSRMEPAWTSMKLTVQIATKLNRSHLINGKVAYLLPCLGRIERDVQDGKSQTVSVEDSTSCIHASFGQREPASEHLLSEPSIVARLAKATLGEKNKIDWDAWTNDYSRVRDAIEKTYPDQFKDFNKRMCTPGGFHRPNKARHREWLTENGKANFIAPPSLSTTGFADEPERLRLMTIRSNDQFNTTIYGYDDRFRGIRGTRMVILMNSADVDARGLRSGQIITLRTDVDDGFAREVPGLMIVPYDIPRGCVAAYYPECNALIPVWHHAGASKTPAAKSVPVKIFA
jgi:molybdopterin-dependent oxidoreductase alpha subunit